MKIAYVVNTYPRPSHSFIRREIAALERQGITVLRFAMRGDRAALVDPDDIAEHARTERVLDAGAARLALDLARALRGPGRFVRALRLALAAGKRGSGGDPGTGGRARHLIYLAEAAYLVRRCQTLGADHIHAHFGTNSATVAMLAHVLGGPRYSFTVHGPEEFDAPRALSLGTKIEQAAFAVAISSFGRSQLMRWARFADWPKVQVVHCGIDPARFATPTPVPAGPGRMVAIGRLSEQKGQMLLIEALALARQQAPGLHLTLVGDGELRAQIEAAIASANLSANVTLTGWLDEAGVRDALAHAHALVLPSFAEGLPMVAMEAMAAARPVIATMVAGIPELVTPETGWLVPAGDVTALARAMVTLAATPSDRLTAMGAQARARALARHDIDAEAARLAILFAGKTPPPRA
jgi:glycosyltransferase involved in cell wall biosynthesis